MNQSFDQSSYLDSIWNPSWNVSDQFVEMATFYESVQSQICQSLTDFEPQLTFQIDKWIREEGGGGKTCVLQRGQTFDKAGVNHSTVTGTILETQLPMFESMCKKAGYGTDHLLGATFSATGISLVIHPKNPFIPTTHANYRYFEINTPDGLIHWFGGGCDLTPYYLNELDCRSFHRHYQSICDRHDSTYYSRFKPWCDEYFYIPHRQEHRGVGGLFFDYLQSSDNSVKEFVKDCANGFIAGYVPQITGHKDDDYSPDQKQWQLIRRGRYVEFNLVYDRGTQFGLKTNGRIESILMSLPLDVCWEYQPNIEQGSPEFDLMQVVKTPRQWV